MYTLVIVVVALAEEVEMLAAAIDVAAVVEGEVGFRHTGLCCWRALVAFVVVVVVVDLAATLKDDRSTMHANFASRQAILQSARALVAINSMQPSISAT